MQPIKDLLGSGRYEEVLIAIETLRPEEKATPDALETAAAATLGKGDAARAEELLEQACTAYPNNDVLVGTLAVARTALNKLDDGLICAERAIELAPGKVDHKLTLGRIRLARGEIGEARTIATEAIEAAPDTAAAHALFGATAMASGEWLLAERALRRALALDGDSKEALRNLSLVLSQTGRSTEAAQVAEQAFLLAPSDLGHQVAFARTLADTGDVERAATLLRRVLAVAPLMWDAQLLAAQLAALRGQTDAGVQALTQAVRRLGNTPETLFGLATFLIFANRPEPALKLIDTLASRIPDDGALRRCRNVAHLMLGRLDATRMLDEGEDPFKAQAILARGGVPPSELVFLARALPELARRHEQPITIAGSREIADILLASGAGVRAETERSDVPALPAEALLDVVRLSGEAATVPYLTPDAERLARWQKAFDGLPRPLIGLAWDTYGIALSLEDAVAATDGLGTLISLETGEARHQLGGRPAILDGGAHVNLYADLVAAIAGVDFVLAPTGVVGATAGALGRPGLIVTGPIPDWTFASRDGMARWYPSLAVVSPAEIGTGGERAAALKSAIRARL
ncbi:tetratricopeptide repeat protein [Segnochrobactrum spirostomi]|nr:tetratricopeptide repeat protein [Segnochrobactrum spirostomi]